jgi:hypothetical protein
VKNGNWKYGGVGSYKRDGSLPQKQDYFDIGQFNLSDDALEALSVPLNPHMDVTSDLEFDIAAKTSPLKDLLPPPHTLVHVDIVGDSIISGHWENRGIMQIVPCTFSDYKDAEPDPVADIEAMIKSYTNYLPAPQEMTVTASFKGEPVDMSGVMEMLFNTRRGATALPDERYAFEYKTAPAPKYPVEESRMK